jgi:hypothetical protein
MTVFAQPKMKISFFTVIVFASLLAPTIARAQDTSDRWLMVEITNEAGRPLKNACVTIVPKAGEIVFRKADRRGHVRFKRPPAGDYRVVVKIDGYQAEKKQVSVGEKSETVAFALKASGTR